MIDNILGLLPFPLKQKTVAAHYGMKEKEYDKLVDMFAYEMISCENKAEILDKHFKKFGATDRLKIFAYAHASQVVSEMQKARHNK